MGAKAGWEKDGEGNVIIRQISGWKVIPEFGATVVVRLEHEGPTLEGDISREALQFAMPAGVAVQFAKEVSEVAAKILDVLPASPPK
jgi:hypothetical protein